MSVPETWKNYNLINRRHVVDGLSFEDIANELDDSTEHIEDFWARYRAEKTRKKKEWDIIHHDHTIEKARKYKESHRDEINARSREYHKNNPNVYKEAYRRKKQRAEAGGYSLYNKAYQDNYKKAHKEILKKQSYDYYARHREDIIEYQKQYYATHREEVLSYHTDYYYEHKQSHIQKLIAEGKLPLDWSPDGRISSYEAVVKAYLDTNDINYIREKTFEGCTAINKLRFDFYLPDLNMIIEVDGQQHFKAIPRGRQTQEEALRDFGIRKAYDEIKNNYCQDNGIELIRIPYNSFKNNEWQNVLSSAIISN